VGKAKDIINKRKSDIIRLYRAGKSNREIESYLLTNFGEKVTYRSIGNYLNEWKKVDHKLEGSRQELVPIVVSEKDIDTNPEDIYSLLMNRIKAIAKKRHLSTRQIRSLVESFTKLEAFRRAVLQDEEDNDDEYLKMIEEVNKLNND
jgi:hypothetical protein